MKPSRSRLAAAASKAERFAAGKPKLSKYALKLGREPLEEKSSVHAHPPRAGHE